MFHDCKIFLTMSDGHNSDDERSSKRAKLSQNKKGGWYVPGKRYGLNKRLELPVLDNYYRGSHASPDHSVVDEHGWYSKVWEMGFVSSVGHINGFRVGKWNLLRPSL